MEVPPCITKKREFYTSLLSFLESSNDSDEEYQNFIKYLDNLNIDKNREELRSILYIIAKISNNHRKQQYFLHKIKQILLHFSEAINQTFSNSDILNIFSKNKLILLFLFEKSIIKVDQSVINFISQKSDKSYIQFFYPEVKPYIGSEKVSQIESELKPQLDHFEEKRQAGENESRLCLLIRNDKVDEFASFVNENKVSLSSSITPSLFETNAFLIKNKKTSLIEYAAFFGSIQIFKYLQKNSVELTPSLWLYAIHGRNLDLIHLLEESNVQPEDSTFEKCLKEAVKCHHNEIAKMIRDNFLDKKVDSLNQESNYKENSLAYCFHYSNYSLLQDDFVDNKFVFYYACQFGEYQIVKLLFSKKNIDINAKIIWIIFFIKFENQLIFIEFKMQTFFMEEFRNIFLNEVYYFHFS